MSGQPLNDPPKVLTVPRLRALGYAHVRFFGGTKSSYDGSFSERVCEVARADSARPEYFIYG